MAFQYKNEGQQWFSQEAHKNPLLVYSRPLFQEIKSKSEQLPHFWESSHVLWFLRWLNATQVTRGGFYQKIQASFELKKVIFHLSIKLKCNDYQQYQHFCENGVYEMTGKESALHEGCPTPSVRGRAAVLSIPAHTFPGNLSPPSNCGELLALCHLAQDILGNRDKGTCSK